MHITNLRKVGGSVMLAVPPALLELLHLQAGNQRTMPDLGARVTMISADLTREQGPGGQAGPSYFLVRMAMEPDVASKLGDLRIIPGMMVDAFIQTYARTPLQYLLKPLQEHMSRTFRER